MTFCSFCEKVINHCKSYMKRKRIASNLYRDQSVRIIVLRVSNRISGLRYIKLADNPGPHRDPHCERVLIVFAHRDVRLLWTIAPGV